MAKVQIAEVVLKFIDQMTGPMARASREVTRHSNVITAEFRKMERAVGTMVGAFAGIGVITSEMSKLNETMKEFSRIQQQILAMGIRSDDRGGFIGAVGSKEYMQELVALQDEAIKKSQQFNVAPKAVLEEIRALRSYGLSPESARQASGPMLALARITGETDYLGMSKKIFGAATEFGLGLGESKAKRTSEIMASTMLYLQSKNVTASEFLEAAKMSGTQAGQAGIGLQEYAGMLAGLAQRQITGSQAGVFIRSAITKMEKPTNKGYEILKKYGGWESFVTYREVTPERIQKALEAQFTLENVPGARMPTQAELARAAAIKDPMQRLDLLKELARRMAPGEVGREEKEAPDVLLRQLEMANLSRGVDVNLAGRYRTDKSGKKTWEPGVYEKLINDPIAYGWIFEGRQLSRSEAMAASIMMAKAVAAAKIEPTLYQKQLEAVNQGWEAAFEKLTNAFQRTWVKFGTSKAGERVLKWINWLADQIDKLGDYFSKLTDKDLDNIEKQVKWVFDWLVTFAIAIKNAVEWFISVWNAIKPDRSLDTPFGRKTDKPDMLSTIIKYFTGKDIRAGEGESGWEFLNPFEWFDATRKKVPGEQPQVPNSAVTESGSGWKYLFDSFMGRAYPTIPDVSKVPTPETPYSPSPTPAMLQLERTQGPRGSFLGDPTQLPESWKISSNYLADIADITAHPTKGELPQVLKEAFLQSLKEWSTGSPSMPTGGAGGFGFGIGGTQLGGSGNYGGIGLGGFGGGSTGNPLIDAIFKGEGTGGDWNTVLAHGKYGGAGANLEKMTLSQVLALSAEIKARAHSSAGPMGAFQLIASTIRRHAALLGMPLDTTMFDRENQVKLFHSVLAREGTGAWAGLHGRRFSPAQIESAMKYVFGDKGVSFGGGVDSARAFLHARSEHPGRPGDTDYLHPDLALHLAALMQAHPGFRLLSGYRLGPSNLGSLTMHGLGAAADVRGAERLTDEELAQFGVYRPWKSAHERNHLQLLGTAGKGDPYAYSLMRDRGSDPEIRKKVWELTHPISKPQTRLDVHIHDDGVRMQAKGNQPIRANYRGKRMAEVGSGHFGTGQQWWKGD